MTSNTNKECYTVEYDGVYAYIRDPSTEIEEELKNSLKYTDKNIEHANRRNPKYKRDPQVYLYSKKNQRFLTGLYPRVKEILEDEEITILTSSLIQKEVSIDKKDLNNFQPFEGYYLWDHQKEAIEKILSSKRGIVQMPTGSGKTVVIATVCSMFPSANIIITSPDVSIMKNNAKTIERVVGEKVGQVGGGKKDYKRITSCTLDTLMSDLKKDSNFLKDTEVFFADECQSIGDNKRSHTICKAMPNTVFRIGVSATALRESGDGLYTEGYLGPIIKETKEEDLQNKGILVKFDYYAIPIADNRLIKYSNYKKGRYDTYNGKPDRQEVYREMIVNNKERNNAIIDLIYSYKQVNYTYGPALILAESIEHSEYIYSELSNFLCPEVELELVKGSATKKKREDVINRLSDKTLRVAVSTRVFNVGVDFPPVGFLIIASGGNATSRLVQQLGRVIRVAEGKSKAIVVDFKDAERYYLNRNYYNRTKALRDRYPSTSISIANADYIKHRIFLSKI